MFVYVFLEFVFFVLLVFFFFKQKTAYEMRISDWSSDVCSSDLPHWGVVNGAVRGALQEISLASLVKPLPLAGGVWGGPVTATHPTNIPSPNPSRKREGRIRSEEHTSELQSLMRISYAVFCLKKKKQLHNNHIQNNLKSDKKR